jgi:electron transfer flavoprotein beta subunit
LNEPRYVKLPDIMKAKKKALDPISAGDLGVEITRGLTELSYEAPPQRQRGVMVENVEELVSALKRKGLL